MICDGSMPRRRSSPLTPRALVRPLAVATCDLDAFIITRPSRPSLPPFPIGHECVAEVLDMARGHPFELGQRQWACPFQISCGDCGALPEWGAPANCATVPFMSTYGFGPAVDQWGGFLSDAVSSYETTCSCPFRRASICRGRQCLRQHQRRMEVGGAAAGRESRRAGPRRRRRRPRIDRVYAAPLRSRSARSPCCTSTPIPAGVSSRPNSAPRRSPTPRPAWDPFRSPWIECRPRGSGARDPLNGTRRHLHEHRDLLRRAADAPAP